MEQATLDFIQSLPISDEQKNELIEKMEWEKELSWSAGYDDAVEQEATDDGTPKYIEPTEDEVTEWLRDVNRRLG